MAKDGYQSAQHHNAQLFRSRREGAGTGTNAKPAHREERPFCQGKRPPAFVEFPVVLQNVPGPVSFPKPGPWKRTELLSAVCGPVQSVRPIQNGKFVIGCYSESARGCGHSVPHPGTHCRGCDRTHSPGPLLNILNTIIGAASGHRQAPPPPSPSLNI